MCVKVVKTGFKWKIVQVGENKPETSHHKSENGEMWVSASDWMKSGGNTSDPY